jgi:PAS domain S-box-containing protein
MNTSKSPTGGLRPAVIFIFITIFLAAGIITVGVISYRSYERNFRAAAEQQLLSIAGLKVDQLVQWRKERLGDGDGFYNNLVFSGMVRRFFDQPADTDARQQLKSWLEKTQVYYQYDGIFLLDTQAVERLTVPSSARSMPDAQEHVAEALRSGRPVFSDFHRNASGLPVTLCVLVPIYDESDTNRPLGVLVLRIDPSVYLYPFIQRWPVLSDSAETLLVRREGDEVVFVNQLRFNTNAVLMVRSPLTNTNLPAVQAALGREGIFEGLDYRGHRVISALHPVPDSPWSMVARRDAAEVFAPVRERLWQVVVMICVLIFGSASVVGLIWRHQRVRFYKEKAQTADAMRASEVRYRRLFEAAQDGILILDAETGMVVDVNPFLIKMLGYSHEMFLGKKVWELGFFKDTFANRDNFVKLQQKEYIRYENMALETAAGQRIDVEFISNVYLVNHQKVIQCNIRDITDRKRAEKSLQREQEFQRTLLDNLADGVVACDAKGTLILFNRVAREWHGMDPLSIPPEEWGRHYDLYESDGITLMAARNVPLLRSFCGETLHDVEMSIVAKGQPPRYILASSCPFFDAQHNLLGAVAVMHDITERKHAEEKLSKTVDSLNASNRDLEQFAYIASHDLQEPLRMVANYVQLLERRYKDKLDQDARDFIYYASDGAVRMQKLIDSLLEYSRLHSRSKPFEPVDLNRVFQRVLRDLEKSILESGAKITAGPLPRVSGDEVQLGQVFQNLISNALKFKGEDSPQIQIAAEDFHGYWKITVCDNGIGIAPEYQGKIFKIFQRLHSRTEYPGTGIGLAVFKRIIERHGGMSGVESAAGKGSSFWFTLPKKEEI